MESYIYRINTLNLQGFYYFYHNFFSQKIASMHEITRHFIFVNTHSHIEESFLLIVIIKL